MLTYPSSSAARPAHIQCPTPVYRCHWEKPDWIPAKISISDQVPLRKVTNFAATIGLIAAMVAGQSHSVSAANRGELWFGALQSENAPNYWEAAWNARRFVEQGVDRQLPRDKIGMAINAAASRSQDQLHIHVSCIAPAVADFVRRHQAEIHGDWTLVRAKLAGHRFMAMKIETESLAQVDPFKLLAHGLPSNKLSIGRQTLAVIGATFGDGRTGFYLLANDSRPSPRNIVSAEALLDDKCAN
jgi:CDP-diacylglycerol pyrophosphatase